MTTTDIVLIIGAVSLGIVNIITALKVNRTELKVQDIAHNVNSAASEAAAKIESLTQTVAALTKALSDAHQAADDLAKRDGA